MFGENEKEILERLPAIDLGAVVQVNDAGGGLKYITRFVGTDGQVLITKLPPVSQFQKDGMGTDEITYRDTFFQKRKMVMRLISHGRVYAFETEVLDIFTQGGRLLMTTYPVSIQARTLRKEPRYPCALASVLVAGEDADEGVLINFSSGGGLLRLNEDTHFKQLNQLRTEEAECILKLQLPFDENPVDIRVTIMSVVPGEHQIGVAFKDGRDVIQRYITSLKLDSISDFF